MPDSCSYAVTTGKIIMWAIYVHAIAHSLGILHCCLGSYTLVMFYYPVSHLK